MPPGTADHGPLECRRALEALRNGVPSRDAVAMLGCDQPAIQRRFEEMLASVAGTSDLTDDSRGMLVSGDFGSGKSHLLAHLEHLALRQGFVCSTVAISKETPFWDLGKVFRSALVNCRVPERNGRPIEELGLALDTRSAAYDDFFRWSDDETASGLSPMFPASLLVHERLNDPELTRQIEDFWAGDPLRKVQINSGLRGIGQLANYRFRAPRVAELPPQRLRFMSRLIRAAGYKGWVVLLDEIELVAQYSILQRARSYSELPRWLGRAPGGSEPGLAAVATVTGDFALEIISPDGTKKDRDYVAAKLAKRYQHLTGLADTGMRILESEAMPLGTPDLHDVAATLEKVRQIYSTAYSWEAPELPLEPRGAGFQNRMRYRVRAAITEWDLRRFDPAYIPQIEGQEFHHGYEENVDLERASPEDEDGGPAGTDGHAGSVEPANESRPGTDAVEAADAASHQPDSPGGAAAPA